MPTLDAETTKAIVEAIVAYGPWGVFILVFMFWGLHTQPQSSKLLETFGTSGTKRTYCISEPCEKLITSTPLGGLTRKEKNEHITNMETFLGIVLPLVLTALVFGLRPFSAWIEQKARESLGQAELIEIYQDSAARFLRDTDPQENAELREIVVWAGHRMMDGARLIEAMLFLRQRLQVNHAQPDPASVALFEALPDDAKHAFAKAIGAAMLVSSFNSLRRGSRYRSLLAWLIQNDREIRDPQQVVYRYRRAHELPTGATKAA